MKKLFMPPNLIFCSQLLHIFALIKNKIEIINLMRSLCLNNLTWCVLWWKYIIRNVNILLESWKTKMKTKTRGSFTELPDGRLETLVILFYSRLAVPWTGQTSERVKEKHPIFVVCHKHILETIGMNFVISPCASKFFDEIPFHLSLI